MNKQDQQIDMVLNNFDFHAVRQAMGALNWQWAPENRVPTLGELYNKAEALLNTAVDENTVISSGGFEAACVDGGMALRFVIEEVTVYEDC